MSKKYLLALDGYGETYETNAYAIIEGNLIPLKEVKSHMVRFYSLAEWSVGADISATYGIFQIPKDLEVITIYRKNPFKSIINTDVLYDMSISDESKVAVLKYFKKEFKDVEHIFKFSNDISMANTIHELRNMISPRDLARSMLNDASTLHEIITFFNCEEGDKDGSN